MEKSEIAIKPANAQALRQMMEQVRSLNAQMSGAVNALAVALDVPPDWRFDTDKMTFTPPPAAGPAAMNVAEDDHA